METAIGYTRRRVLQENRDAVMSNVTQDLAQIRPCDDVVSADFLHAIDQILEVLDAFQRQFIRPQGVRGRGTSQGESDDWAFLLGSKSVSQPQIRQDCPDRGRPIRHSRIYG